MPDQSPQDFYLGLSSQPFALRLLWSLQATPFRVATRVTAVKEGLGEQPR
jgi:hypothetical protein